MKQQDIKQLLYRAASPHCDDEELDKIREMLVRAASQTGCDVGVSVYFQSLRCLGRRLFTQEAAMLFFLHFCSDRKNPKALVNSMLDRALVESILHRPVASPA